MDPGRQISRPKGLHNPLKRSFWLFFARLGGPGAHTFLYILFLHISTPFSRVFIPLGPPPGLPKSIFEQPSHSFCMFLLSVLNPFVNDFDASWASFWNPLAPFGRSFGSLWSPLDITFPLQRGGDICIYPLLSLSGCSLPSLQTRKRSRHVCKKRGKYGKGARQPGKNHWIHTSQGLVLILILGTLCSRKLLQGALQKTGYAVHCLPQKRWEF